MKNVHVKRLPDGCTEITGIDGDASFHAVLNKNRTGGIIKYKYWHGERMEAIEEATLGDLLEEIHKATNEPHPKILNAIKPFIPKKWESDPCPECGSPVINGVCQGFNCKERLL